MTARVERPSSLSACVGGVMMINDLHQTDGPPHFLDDVKLSVMTGRAALCQCKVEGIALNGRDI